jgi:capsular polysaccharide biosynthesis protein
LVGLSIVEAAKGADFFENSVEFEPTGSIWLGSEMRQSKHAEAFSAPSRTATIRSYRIPQAVVAGDTMNVFQHGRLIAETASFGGKARLAELPADATPIHISARAILGATPTHGTYLHWFSQCLPAIDWALACNSEYEPHLAMPALQPWQRETLRLLGYDGIATTTLDSGLFYRFETCQYSTLLDSTTPFLISGCVLDTLKRLAKAIPEPATAYDRVYIYNHDTYYGMLVNEFDLIDFFRARGFHILIPDVNNITEQIQICRSARLIVSTHGNAVTNIAFCRPGTVVWELFPAQYVNPCYSRLAQGAGLSYRADLSDSLGSNPQYSWRVDLKSVASWCQDVETELAKASAGAHRRTSFGFAKRPGEKCTGPFKRVIPLASMLAEFENLGDDCEFGYVQRAGGAEPLGLFRFAGFSVPRERRLHYLIAAIEEQLERLTQPGALCVQLRGEPGQNREYIARHTVYNLERHTSRYENESTLAAVEKEQYNVQAFLGRKFLDDLVVAPKIWVFKSRFPYTGGEVQRLLNVLRQHGPNRLLWVMYADEDHTPGTVERLGEHLLRGFIAPHPGGGAVDFFSGPWFTVCRKAYDLFHHSVGCTQQEIDLARTKLSV